MKKVEHCEHGFVTTQHCNSCFGVRQNLLSELTNSLEEVSEKLIKRKTILACIALLNRVDYNGNQKAIEALQELYDNV